MIFDRKYIFGFLGVVLVGVVLYYFSDIVGYVIMAWVVSLIGAPLMRLFKRVFGRNTSAVLTLVTLSFGLVLLVSLFVPQIVDQAKTLSTIDYEKLGNTLKEPISDWNNWLVNRGLIDGEIIDPHSIDTVQISDDEELTIPDLYGYVQIDTMLVLPSQDSSDTNIALYLNLPIPTDKMEKMQEEHQHLEGNFYDRMRKNIVEFIDPQRIPRLFSSILGFVGNFMMTLMSVFFISFFFLREQGLFVHMITSIVPNEYEDQAIKAIDESTELLVRYFVGVIIQISIITAIVTIGLSIFGIKNALLIGFFAGLMNVIPYIGPFIGAAFGVMITISSNLDLSFYNELLPMIVKVLVVFFGMQMIDNFIIQPNIFSKSVKAHPLEIFIVVLIGAKLGGIMGMVLAIPVYTILRVLARVFFSQFKIVQRITEGL